MAWILLLLQLHGLLAASVLRRSGRWMARSGLDDKILRFLKTIPRNCSFVEDIKTSNTLEVFVAA